jgi:hypothetical protein
MRRLVLLVLFVAALALAATASAAKTNGNGSGTESQFGPFASSSTDNGSCSQPWAEDTFNRVFKVKDNGDGTFLVREEFKQGSFVTLDAPSPGACETDSHHGTHVRAGVTGHMHGYLQGTVTSTTFNPDGCSAAGADCTTTQGFLLAVFGAAGPATFTCNLGYAGCDFKFEYAAGDQNLLFHHWEDRSTNPPGGEIFRGDIADA